MKWCNKRDCPHFYEKGLTMVEMLMVIGILVVIVGTSWLSLRGFLSGRSIEGTAESLKSLIRSAQTSAKETESVQKIFFTKKEAIWVRYAGKTKEEVKGLTIKEGIVESKQTFKNKVELTALLIENESMPVPIEAEEDIGIVIDEKGIAESARIVLGRERETIDITVGGSIVASGGGLGVLDANVGAQFIEPVEAKSGEDALIVQTEPLSARGWQVVTVNNVDKVKEVKLRVKLDSRLPSSAHIHAYVFPGWYENKPAAHGVIGEQTMLNMKSPSIPLLQRGNKKGGLKLYRESTEDCMAFMPGNYKASGTVKKENGVVPEGLKVMVYYELGNNIFQYEGEDYELITIDSGGLYKWEFEGNLASVLISLGDTTYSQQPETGAGYPYFFAFDGGSQTIPNNITANFIVWKKAKYKIRGNVNGPAVENVKIDIKHVPTVFYNIPTAYKDKGMNPVPAMTQDNGSYSSMELAADHYYELKPSKLGFVFEPPSVTIFLDDNKTQNFTVKREGQSPFIESKFPFGDWGYTESSILNAAIAVSVPVFSDQVLSYYVYKNKIIPMRSPMKSYSGSEVLPMYSKVTYTQNVGYKLHTSLVPANTLNPGGLSDFSTEAASLIFENPNSATLTNAYWKNGYVYSSFAGQSAHLSKPIEKETNQGEWSEWITIQVSSLPSKTKFLRVAIAAYTQTESGEQVFNLNPTSSSTNPLQTIVNVNQFDYENDPFIVHYPWSNLINSPFWLSNYAYAMKPLLRPYGVNALAIKGPITGENYRNTGKPYQGFWYGPLYLDWDLILGEESFYWLLGWTTGAYEITDTRWRFKQQGDSYGFTAFAPPAHYLLKNFAYLSYWYLFQNVVYNEPSLVTSLTKRIQEPLNLLKHINNWGWIKLFGRPDPDITPFSIPRESSSLSVPFLENPKYPIWLAGLPAGFGQGRINSSPDLYSSYYYLQERINHTMLDIGIWALLTSQSSPGDEGGGGGGAFGPRDEDAFESIFGVGPESGGQNSNTSPTCGNFEEFSVGGETLASWWRWYQNIPWAKGQAFPKKIGPLPADISARTGWERPVMTFPSKYQDFFNAYDNYRANFLNSYNALQVVNAPHTIFMSTSHYPLGIIQISVKK